MNFYKTNIKYEPKDFGQNCKTPLGLLQGANFSDEQIIMFNEKQI